jgi:MHS family alpha-ketoglutarate permease-like MFS transporter
VSSKDNLIAAQKAGMLRGTSFIPAPLAARLAANECSVLTRDAMSRKPLLIGFGILGALCAVPIMTALSNTKDVWVAFALIMCALIIVSGYTSINAVVKAELFPANVRALGVGFPYAIAVSIFGGTAEYVALDFKNYGHQEWFYWYVSICIALSLLLYITMNDTRTYSKIED